MGTPRKAVGCLWDNEFYLMQQRHNFVEVRVARRDQSRMRLPVGYSHLRQDLGAILAKERKSRRLKQEAFADDLGIRRETLSRIETGRVWPLPETLDRFLRLFEWDWDKVAEKGRAKASRRFDGSWHGERIKAFGEAVRAARRARRLSLRAVSEKSALSPAQISRLERGELGRSRIILDHPDDAPLPKEDRRIVVTDGFLSELAGYFPWSLSSSSTESG